MTREQSCISKRGIMFEVPMNSTMSTILEQTVLKPESYTFRMARNGMKTENSIDIDSGCPLV